jgi:hypothetical protein
MPGASYLRSQAEMCLEVAAKISDRKAAADLRTQAARYLAQAAEIESASERSLPKPDH